MLKIRMSRAGRKHVPFFRIVLTEHAQSAKHGFQKILGFYNPISKELRIDMDEASKYIAQGAQYSESLKKVLVRTGKVQA
ncbi:MAG TPA: 30S ribosomal protein S16 [bacterium]|nr:30S ribosomal protein S16 [bacterium]